MIDVPVLDQIIVFLLACFAVFIFTTRQAEGIVLLQSSLVLWRDALQGSLIRLPCLCRVFDVVDKVNDLRDGFGCVGVDGIRLNRGRSPTLMRLLILSASL